MSALIAIALLSLAAQVPPAAPQALSPHSGPLQVVTLQDALELAAQRGVAIRIARAEADAAAAEEARAFSVLLPRVDADASYAFSCQVDGGARLDCTDQTVQFVSDDFLSGQELLFHSVADGSRAQAQQIPDPAQQQALAARADALDAAGTSIGKTDNAPVVLSPAHLATGSITLSVPVLVLPAWAALTGASDVKAFRGAAATAALRQVRAGTAQLWLAATAAERIVDVAAARVQDAHTRADAAANGEATGAVSPLLVDAARVEELAAALALTEAQSNARRARAALGVVIGMHEDFALGSSEEVLAVLTGAPVDSADRLVERAHGHRIELKAAALSARLAEQSARAAVLGYAPELRAFAQGRGTTNTGGFVAAPVGASVGLALRWNLFDGGERNGRVSGANAAAAIASAQADDARARVDADVYGALDDIARADAVVRVAAEAAALARARERAIELAISTGARSDVDLAAVIAARHAAEVDLVRAEVATAAARVSVARACGDDVTP